MIKSSFGDRLDAWIHRLFPFLFGRFGHLFSPDVLTCCGALVSLAAAVFLARGEGLIGGLLILFGGFFDLVDGVVARHQGVSTRFGAFLDSTLDRFVDMVLLLGVVVYYAGALDATMAAVAGGVLVASVITSYAKARAETEIEVLDGGLLERGERIGGLAIGALFGILDLMLWVLLIGSWITVAQRFRVAYVELGKLDASESDVRDAGGGTA